MDLKSMTPYQLCELYEQIIEQAYKLGIHDELSDELDFCEVEYYSTSKLVSLMEWIARNHNVLNALSEVYQENKENWCADGRNQIKLIFKQLKLYHTSKKNEQNKN